MPDGPLFADRDAVAAVIGRIAAEELLPRFGSLSATDVREKKPGDPVTVADLAAERRLAHELPPLLPGSLVVGEEEAEDNPEILARLADDVPVWVVDPLDGTRNFARGRECFALIVALVRGARTLAGWIHDPVSGSTIWAAEGQGAFRLSPTAAPERLHIPPPAPLVELRGSVGWRVRRRFEDRGIRPVGDMVRYGCTGREYMDLATGRLHFSHYKRLKPWDHAAGILIFEEAGGYAALMEDGRPYRPLGHIVEGTLLTAPNAATWRDLQRLIESG